MSEVKPGSKTLDIQDLSWDNRNMHFHMELWGSLRSLSVCIQGFPFVRTFVDICMLDRQSLCICLLVTMIVSLSSSLNSMSQSLYSFRPFSLSVYTRISQIFCYWLLVCMSACLCDFLRMFQSLCFLFVYVYLHAIFPLSVCLCAWVRLKQKNSRWKKGENHWMLYSKFESELNCHFKYLICTIMAHVNWYIVSREHFLSYRLLTPCLLQAVYIKLKEVRSYIDTYQC